MEGVASETRSAAVDGLKHAICLRETGETFLCSGSETLLQGMARIGRKCIPAGCLNGGCGVCKVAIRTGEVRKLGAMSRAHVSESEEGKGIVLACRVAPAGPVELEVIGKLKKIVASTPWGSITSCVPSGATGPDGQSDEVGK